MAQPLAVALHALRRTTVQPSQVCVVIGVGGIGSFILGAAAAKGITRPIAVDIDDHRLRTAQILGAETVIDARTEDVAAIVLEVTGGDGADVVIEASGAPGTQTAIKATRRGGRVIIVGLQATPTEIDLFALTTREVEITTAVAHVCDVDLPESLEIIAHGSLAETVLDRVIPLDNLVELGIRPLVERTRAERSSSIPRPPDDRPRRRGARDGRRAHARRRVQLDLPVCPASTTTSTGSSACRSTSSRRNETTSRGS